jgi:Autographiviridae endonuclease VII
VQRKREQNATYQREWRAKNVGRVRPVEAQRARKLYESSPQRRRYIWGHNLMRFYGMTIEAYEALEQQQGGVCAICEGPPLGRAIRLHVDHCHETGRVRGLLCGKCNTAIAFLGDNPNLLKRVADYFSEE